jgi:hypothetical protein
MNAVRRKVLPRRRPGQRPGFSSYVATALADYQERESLDEILASWQAETPIPEELRRQAAAQMDGIGLRGSPQPGDRKPG